MINYFLFYDSKNLLMAKRAWTEEEYSRRAKYLSDAAYAVRVSATEYNETSVQKQNEILNNKIKELLNDN